MNTISITKQEYLSAVSLHQPLTKRQVVLYSALVAGSLALGCILWRYWPGAVAGGLVGGSIGGVIGYWIQRIVYVPWKARKVYEQQKSLRESAEFSWSSAGMSVRAETASSTTPWSNYTRWRENKDVFNLYHSDLIFQIVPKRAFLSSESELEFRAFLGGVRNA